MKILYDHQIFEAQNFGGISRYFTELIKYNENSDLSLGYSDNIYIKNNYFDKYKILPKNYVGNNFFPNIQFIGKKKLIRFYKKLKKKNNYDISIKHLKNSNFDIFHPTYYDTYFLNYLKKKPFVLTVYDMIHELFPGFFENDKSTILNKKKLILSANKIIAISNQTKNDLIKFFPDCENKINVIYLGFSFSNISINFPKENYILYTGLRQGYKNFNIFIEAISPLLKKYDFYLICTGQPFNNYEICFFKKLNIFDRIIFKYVSDEELANLFSKATAFVFPSLYEGFGIPILEAFSTGCPAILSKTSSIFEIGSDSAIYFDPYSVDDIRNKVELVITSQSLQKELSHKGIKRVSFFSWKKCFEETMQLYNNIT